MSLSYECIICTADLFYHFINLVSFPCQQTARIIAKIACWSVEPLDGSDLLLYLTWLRDQLTLNVIIIDYVFIILKD